MVPFIVWCNLGLDRPAPAVGFTYSGRMGTQIVLGCSLVLFGLILVRAAHFMAGRSRSEQLAFYAGFDCDLVGVERVFLAF